MSIVKEEAKKIINRLPLNATWDDLLHEFYVIKKIELALDVVSKGKTVPHEEVKRRLLSK